MKNKLSLKVGALLMEILIACWSRPAEAYWPNASTVERAALWFGRLFKSEGPAIKNEVEQFLKSEGPTIKNEAEQLLKSEGSAVKNAVAHIPVQTAREAENATAQAVPEIRTAAAQSRETAPHGIPVTQTKEWVAELNAPPRIANAERVMQESAREAATIAKTSESTIARSNIANAVSRLSVRDYVAQMKQGMPGFSYEPPTMLAIVPFDKNTYLNIFPKEIWTAKREREIKNLSAQFSILRHATILEGTNDGEAALHDAIKNFGQGPMVIFGHSEAGRNEERILRLPDGTTLTSNQIKNYCFSVQRHCFILTCYGSDFGLEKEEVMFQEAANVWLRSIEGITRYEEPPSSMEGVLNRMQKEKQLSSIRDVTLAGGAVGAPTFAIAYLAIKHPSSPKHISKHRRGRG
jgi:hypothetical protein